VKRSALLLTSLALALGCAPAPRREPATPAAPSPSPVTPRAARPAPTAETPAPSAEPEARVPRVQGEQHCPDGMALIFRMQGPYCIDRYEASLVRVAKGGSATPYPHNHSVDGIESEVRAVSVAGVRPQGYISGVQASLVCRNAGKRLCEVDEWVLACRGPKLTRYPYGNTRRANVCNDRFKVLDHHPVPILWKKDPLDPSDAKLMWHPRFMNDSRLLEFDHTTVPTGSFAQCTNEYGVYDMVGNLHEWVNDPEGTFFGGFFMDTYQNGEGCEYRTKGHGFEYHDYSTGFRCCADPVSK
jgi:Sulfatase-modifying factor enzyme 1